MDFSHVFIPLGNKKLKLWPGEKGRFTIMKLDDTKAQVLYQQLEFDNYMFLRNLSRMEEEVPPMDNSYICLEDFDGSWASSGF